MSGPNTSGEYESVLNEARMALARAIGLLEAHWEFCADPFPDASLRRALDRIETKPRRVPLASNQEIEGYYGQRFEQNINRRAAEACRNILKQTTGNTAWFGWVARHLDQLADAEEAASSGRPT